jgi:NADPH-dependent curcumin reductase CurA
MCFSSGTQVAVIELWNRTEISLLYTGAIMETNASTLSSTTNTQQKESLNRRIVLHQRPVGAPTVQDFRIEESPLPVPVPGQVLLRTLFLSLDPYMRGRMGAEPSYAEPVAIGGVMVAGAVAQVQLSLNPDFVCGDMVLCSPGWQEYAISDGSDITRLDSGMMHPSLALGALGMPGFTAYMGLLDIGQPKEGEVVVVAAASGAVGSVVGQIAKLLKGCRVVGIAGGADKCRFVIDELGFDECVDRRSDDFPQQLAAACPKGIDIYFESVGGPVFDAVLPLLNAKARIPLCGLIAQYNDTGLSSGADRLNVLTRTILTKRIKMQGFIIFDDFGDRYGEFYQQMSSWVAEGRIHYREDIVEGLENAPEAFIGLLEGKNFGKLIVRVAE